MPNALKAPVPGTDPLSSDVAQLANLFSALLDAGALQFVGPQSTPAAPTAAASGTAGNLNGAYMWTVVLVTGWKQGDGSYFVSGFAPSPASTSLSLANQEANLSAIATGTSVVIGRAIYRTAAGGASGSEKFAGIIWDNTTTTWTDNIADANLGTGMPTSTSSPAAYGTAIPAAVPASNTTGTYLNGYLRTDSAAPNPQVVSNSVTFSGGATLSNFYMSNNLGSGKETQFGVGATVSGVVADLFGIAEQGVSWALGLDHNGNIGLAGSLTAYDNVSTTSGSIVGHTYIGTPGYSNPSSLGSTEQGIYFGWNYSAGNGESDIFCYGQGGNGGLNVYNTNQAANNAWTEIFTVDHSGLAKAGSGATNALLQALSGGYKVESGTASVYCGASTNQWYTTASVPFSTSFTTTPVVLAQVVGSNSQFFQNIGTNPSTSGFTMTGYTGTGGNLTLTFQYIAIGS